jgi:hypothetical protein
MKQLIVFNYFSVPQEVFNQLAAAKDRYETTTDLLVESEEFPTTDIDKFWIQLGQYLEESPALTAVYGTEEWDSELRVSSPAQVVELAQTLAEIDLKQLEEEYGGELINSAQELQSFYSEAAERGDAVIVIAQ